MKRKYDKLTDELTNLCFRCSKIDIKHLLDPHLKIESSGFHIAVLGKPQSKDFQRACPLCQLFLSVAPQYQRQYKLELRLFQGVPDKGAQTGSSDHELEEDSRILAVIRHNQRLNYHAVTSEIGARGLLHPVLPDSERGCRVQIVNPQAIPYALLKAWVKTCNTHHSTTHCTWNLDRGRLPIQLYVLDCLKHVVVPLPKNAKYFALSYVWGATTKASHWTLDTSRPASNDEIVPISEFPLTVQDAMQVVQNMGYQYLWVDKYCIELNQKQQAIMNMHEIYSKAESTIVALYGKNSEAGLPGVSGTPRLSRQYASALDGQLISSFPPLWSVINDSVWSTRGWTYQEARLSCRCLFFTEHQVYFFCRNATLSEAMPSQDWTSRAKQNFLTQGLDPTMFDGALNGLPKGLFLDRFTYSKRALTYQQDRLHAFRGLLNAHSIFTLWGVPIIPRTWNLDPCIGFAMGLLWTRRPSWFGSRHLKENVRASYTRLLGFPTWSWASVDGDIFQQTHGPQSFYGKYLGPFSPECVSEETIAQNARISRNDRHQPFEVNKIRSNLRVELSAPRISLGEAIKTSNYYLLPEDSRLILLEGELVKVRLIKGNVFQFCMQDGNPILEIPGIIASFDIDTADVDVPTNKFELQDALILIEWIDDQPQSETRFVLMLLKWVDENVAERKGLLGEYRDCWKTNLVKMIPRRRAKFDLR